jgi:hypothetical protein
MKRSETQQYIGLLKRRVASLRLMAKELRECRESFTGMDLEAIREHIAYQRGLCSEIRSLDDELRVLRRQLAVRSGLEPEEMRAARFEGLFDAYAATELRQVIGDLTEVQKGVRRLNGVYAGLLRRSRRTINVLINFMASYVGTYNPSVGRSGWSFPW